ncbi:uncharacterized protein LOC143301768 [Babylonia areolata]|uniref:uncharacterized protein LOC143301768 n=1 Tax=Babylonia areolata TaxID=304850 RepID=UPI003FD38137
MSDLFPVVNGVKQGYILAPALFSILVSAMQIDAFQDYYVITRKRDRLDVRVMRTMCGTNCWSNHNLTVSKFRLCILSMKKTPRSKVAEGFTNDLQGRLADIPQKDRTSIEEQWMAFRDAVYTTALEHLRPATRRKQDWFNENEEEIQALLAEKHQLFRAHENDTTSQAKEDDTANAKRKVEKKFCEMQDSWFSKKADEIYGYADSHNTKCLYDVLKAVYGPQSSGSSPILNTDRTQLLTEKKQILEHWADHYNEILNHPADIEDEAIARLPQVKISDDLDTLPTEDEVRKAVKQHTCGKVPGSDVIPAEEKCQEENSDLFMNVFVLTKVSDTVCREGLWKIIEKFGSPSKFITIVWQFHNGIIVEALDYGDKSKSFSVTNSVKQGCVLATILISMVFSAVLTDAFLDCKGIHIRYRTDCRLFNLKYL